MKALRWCSVLAVIAFAPSGGAQAEDACTTPPGTTSGTAIECTFEKAVGRAWTEGTTRLRAALVRPSDAAKREAFYELSKMMVRYEANLTTGDVELTMSGTTEKGRIDDLDKASLEATVKALYGAWQATRGAAPSAQAGERVAACLDRATGSVATLQCFYHPDMR